MNETYLCRGKTAVQLYRQVQRLPIYDYHCHLSPQEIWEDRPFTNIGEMWLGGDHYKWRLMRQAGVEEKYITGSASWHDKFLRYAEVMELAAGNPLYHWNKMELEQYFEVTEPLTAESAERIWQQANRVIAERQLSPRKLIAQSNVAFLATTDDVAGTLEYHEKLRQAGLCVEIVPSFRTDNVLMANRPGYADYIRTLSVTCGLPITTLAQLKQALSARLDVFCAHGCVFTDVGIPLFPDRIAPEQEAAAAFADALAGRPLTADALNGFIGNLFVFLGGEYRKRRLVMQWHLGAYRNASTAMLQKLGPDAGCDCIADAVSGNAVCRLLDAIEQTGGLPQTILYSLNPSAHAQLISAAGSFARVRYGAAWWFCDHKRGIAEVLQLLAEEGYLAAFPGMLTDSRSFLSYARHDYFRRILCEVLGGWVDAGELTAQAAEKVAHAVCCGNLQRLLRDCRAPKEATA